MARYQARSSLLRRRPLIVQPLVIAIIFILLFRYPGLDLEFPFPSFLLPQCLTNRLKSTPPKCAYATLLPSPNDNTTTSYILGNEEGSDPYFTCILLLTYQLLQSPRTRTRNSISFLVLIDSTLPASKRELLTLLGATLIEVEPILTGQSWMQPLVPHWSQLTTKLRLFELDSWDRILFLDADTFLLGSLDGVFTDSAACQLLKPRDLSPRKLDEAPLPLSYVFASLGEVLHTSHPWPPLPWPRFKAGFFLLKPSRVLYNYYIMLLTVENKFDSTYVEQALLNYAHREEGNMPWARLWYGWNVNLPTWRDVKGGVRSVHAKLWEEGSELRPVDERLRGLWRERRGEMEVWLKVKRRGSEKEVVVRG